MVFAAYIQGSFGANMVTVTPAGSATPAPVEIESAEAACFEISEILPFGFTPDSQSILIRGMAGVQIFNLETLTEARFLQAPQNILAATLSPDGQYVAADLAAGLYMWRLSDGELAWNEVKNSMTIAFSPDGRYLAYADIDEHSDVFIRTVDGLEIVQVLAGHQSPVWGLFFSPDSQLLVSTDGLEIRIWHIEAGSLRYIGKAACP